MNEQPSLIENTGSGAGSTATTDQASSSSSSFSGDVDVDGPAVTIHTGSSVWTLAGEDLLVVASVVQTLLLLTVTYYEIKHA